MKKIRRKNQYNRIPYYDYNQIPCYEEDRPMIVREKPTGCSASEARERFRLAETYEEEKEAFYDYVDSFVHKFSDLWKNPNCSGDIRRVDNAFEDEEIWKYKYITDLVHQNRNGRYRKEWLEKEGLSLVKLLRIGWDLEDLTAAGYKEEEIYHDIFERECWINEQGEVESA